MVLKSLKFNLMNRPEIQNRDQGPSRSRLSRFIAMMRLKKICQFWQQRKKYLAFLFETLLEKTNQSFQKTNQSFQGGGGSVVILAADYSFRDSEGYN